MQQRLLVIFICYYLENSVKFLIFVYLLTTILFNNKLYENIIIDCTNLCIYRKFNCSEIYKIHIQKHIKYLSKLLSI